MSHGRESSTSCSKNNKYDKERERERERQRMRGGSFDFQDEKVKTLAHDALLTDCPLEVGEREKLKARGVP